MNKPANSCGLLHGSDLLIRTADTLCMNHILCVFQRYASWINGDFMRAFLINRAESYCVRLQLLCRIGVLFHVCLIVIFSCELAALNFS